MFRCRTRHSPFSARKILSPLSRQAVTAGLFFSLCTGFSNAVANEQEEADGEEAAGSDILIQNPKQEIINEYRVNGKLYMIRITPEKGAPYYLVDADGDGELETRTNELAPNFLIPSWVIFSW